MLTIISYLFSISLFISILFINNVWINNLNELKFQFVSVKDESDNFNKSDNIDNLENEGEYEIKDIDADIDVDCEGEIKSNSLNDID